MTDISNESKFTVNRKKAMLENTIREFMNEADKVCYAEIVSKMEDMKTLLSKSNSFRKTAKEKNEGLNKCQHILKELFKKKGDLVSCP